MSITALANLNLMYERGEFSTAEYVQALRNLYPKVDIKTQPLVRRRLESVLKAS